jgi:hypothetical protein
MLLSDLEKRARRLKREGREAERRLAPVQLVERRVAHEHLPAVFRKVGAPVHAEVDEEYREIYGGTQEPELTVLKGVGPFALALYRGSVLMGDVDVDVDVYVDVDVDAPPAEAAVRQVDREVSHQAYQQIINRGVTSARATP